MVYFLPHFSYKVSVLHGSPEQWNNSYKFGNFPFQFFHFPYPLFSDALHVIDATQLDKAVRGCTKVGPTLKKGLKYMLFRRPIQPKLLLGFFYRNGTTLARIAATSQIQKSCYKTQGYCSLSESIPWVFLPLCHELTTVWFFVFFFFFLKVCFKPDKCTLFKNKIQKTKKTPLISILGRYSAWKLHPDTHRLGKLQAPKAVAYKDKGMGNFCNK